MTRILATGDLHLGHIGQDSPLDPESGMPWALASAARCWGRATEIAIDRGVDLVLVAGDIFHRRDATDAARECFAEGLRNLVGSDIPVVLIPGNHDGPDVPGGPWAGDSWRELAPLVRIVSKPEIIEVEGLRIAALPWIPRTGLMARRPGIRRDEAEQAVMDALGEVLGALRAEGADLLTGHWSVQGAVLDNDRDLTTVGEPVIPLADIDGPWPLAIFGHIHKRQTIQAGGTAFHYTGSSDRVSFGEETARKVALEIEYVSDDVRITEHELPARRFVTVAPPAFELLPTALNEVEVEGAIVRIRMPLTEAEDAVFDRAATQQSLLRAGARVVRFDLDVERKTRARSERVTASLSDVEAFDEWMEVRGIPEEDRPRLREGWKRLMEEVSG